MNNFRYVIPAGTTAYYVSKAGNDSNDGLTPDTPKATLSGALSAIGALSTATAVTVVVGSGTYEEAIIGNAKVAAGSNFVADGNVVFRGNGSNAFNMTGMLGGGVNGFVFDNYASIIFRAGITNCIVKNMPSVSNVAGGGSTGLNLNVIWVNCTIVSSMQYTYSIFIDCMVGGNANTVLQNCYLNANTYFTAQASAAVAANFDYNNIMGMLRNGTSGTYKSLADFSADFPALNTHSFNLPPKFNSVAKLDFTLQVDSPHLNAASDNTKNIGGTSYAAASVFATDPEWQIANGAVISKSDGVNPDLIISGGDLVLAPGKTSGYIIGAPKKIAANPVTIQLMACNGFFLFNKSQAGGSATNNNVPDENVYASGTMGGNPDRLSYGMRFFDGDSMPGSDADWPNANVGTPGTFMRFEWNKQPIFDNNGYGNGSASFNATGATSTVSATWIQRKITLTNAYV